MDEDSVDSLVRDEGEHYKHNQPDIISWKNSALCDHKTNTQSNDSDDSSDVDVALIIRHKRRVTQFSESGSDADNPNSDENTFAKTILNGNNVNTNSSDSETGHANNIQRSRIRKASSSDSNSNLESVVKPSKNDGQQNRMNMKRDKMKQKFKSLLTSRGKYSDQTEGIQPMSRSDVGDGGHSDSPNTSDEEAASINKIRQKIKDRTMHLKSTLYDPDTSEEEDDLPKKIAITKQRIKKTAKSTKPTSPKPIRMSAKQAMENMTKIKSVSNKMLREKDVSLPYHRPKPLSLKEIMSRRKLAVSSDGKALPIKMNEEQLKEYAQQLEQRQKEMIDLCKSDTDEEAAENEEKSENMSTNNDTMYDDLVETTMDGNKSNELIDKSEEHKPEEMDIDDNKSDQTTLPPAEIEFRNENVINQNSFEVNSEVFINNVETHSIIENEIEEDKPSEEKIVKKQNCDVSKDNIENTSAEMVLVYNDSVENIKPSEDTECNGTKDDGQNNEIVFNTKVGTENDSQLIYLHYDSEKHLHSEDIASKECSEIVDLTSNGPRDITENEANKDGFSDDDFNIDDIDKLIENAEILISQTDTSSPMLIKDAIDFNSKPKIIGAPGMVIDLDGTVTPKKLTGVELLRERFAFFAKLKTPEDLEKQKETRVKPGTQHQKLKQQLENEIAEKRSIEWAKRLEEEKQQQKELDEIRGEGSDDDDIEKIKAKIADNEKNDGQEEESGTEEETEEEPEEDDMLVEDKPRKRNPMLADEAEESDCDETEDGGPKRNEMDNESDDGEKGGDEIDNDDDEYDEVSDDSSEDSDQEENKPKKGRILKAFEDSDDEENVVKASDEVKDSNSIQKDLKELSIPEDKIEQLQISTESPVTKFTQDDELPLAQKSQSEDLFPSQESQVKSQDNKQANASADEKDFGTQTFSILDSCVQDSTVDVDKLDKIKPISQSCNETQSFSKELTVVAGISADALIDKLLPSQGSSQFITPTQTQEIGEDILALCTGQFYDNQFVSQVDNLDHKASQFQAINKGKNDMPLSSQELGRKHSENSDLAGNKTLLEDSNAMTISVGATDIGPERKEINNEDLGHETKNESDLKTNRTNKQQITEDNILLKSILDELNEPELPKTKKYFNGDDNKNKENKIDIANIQAKKKFIIESDEEENEDRKPKKKKMKKKKLEDRALQISDDEDEDLVDEQEDEEGEDVSEMEYDEERVVEYDSEENEIEVRPEEKSKKKRKATEFFEKEAELTSEDEWAGSGDEDEAGLDRMEREEGDDDHFHQGKLQSVLGQIHMRDVLDQDKREVRLIQELLFEDGDLGDGSRQRKFRWRTDEGGEDGETTYHEFHTQEEEFESEEQWRKQRHERHVFLQQLQNEGVEELNVSVNRSSLIKASLSKSILTSAALDIHEKTENVAPLPEKKPKDVPSPKKPFVLCQQNYHGSLLSRGRSALARLAALATPIATDEDTPKAGSLAPSSKRNFVFAALSQEEVPKVTKRKVESAGTPKLVKKMKIDEKQEYRRNSLLDHFKA